MSEEMKVEHKQVIKGTFWGLAGMFASKFLTFVYTILIARMFSQSDIGAFNLALSIASIILVFSDFGLSSTFARYIPYYLGKKEEKKVGELLNVSFIWAGVFSLILSILLLLFAGNIADFYKNEGLVTPIKFMAIYIIGGTFLGFVFNILNSYQKIKESNLVNSIQIVLKLILTIGLYYLGSSGQVSISFGFTVAYILTLGISLFLIKSQIKEAFGTKNFDIKKQIEMLKEIVPFGIMLTLTTLFWSVATNVDRIMLGYLLPTAEASAKIAIYTMAISFASLIAAFSGIVIVIMLPVLSSMHGGGKIHEAHGISKSAGRWLIFLVAPFVIIMTAIPHEILSLFYGSAYASGGIVLSIFAVGMFIRSLSLVHGAMLASLRIVKIELYAALLAVLLNILLNIVTIPTYGMEGSAVASLISFFAVSTIIIYYSNKIAKFGWREEFTKPIIAAITTCIVLWILHDKIVQLVSINVQINTGIDLVNNISLKVIRLVVFGLLFAGISGLYFAILSIIKGFEKEDRELLGSMLHRTKVPKNIISLAQQMMRGIEN